MSAPFHTLAAVVLPRGMVWADEFDWSPFEKSAEYSTTGALLVDAGTRQAGRPITLLGANDAGWIRRAALTALHDLAADPDPAAVHTLTLADGRVFSVQFAPGDCITATPVGRPELPPDSHPYVATVRLIQV